jgi:hypothetical protein
MMNALPPPGLPLTAKREREPCDAGHAPRRRLRDRMAERDGTDNPTLTRRYELQNLLLLIDDDLRETARAMGGIERFLADALRSLDDEEVRATELLRLAGDGDVLERMDTLCESLASLRRRFGAIARSLSTPASTPAAAPR